MSEQRINEYIEGKYGKLGVDRYAAVYAYIVIESLSNVHSQCNSIAAIQVLNQIIHVITLMR